jgi:hypothetical protein
MVILVSGGAFEAVGGSWWSLEKEKVRWFGNKKKLFWLIFLPLFSLNFVFFFLHEIHPYL